MQVLKGGGGWRGVVNATPRPLYPRERDPVPIVQEAGWASGQVWRGMDKRRFLALNGVRTPDSPGFSEWLYQLNWIYYMLTL
jgi:hypothetical protein